MKLRHWQKFLILLIFFIPINNQVVAQSVIQKEKHITLLCQFHGSSVEETKSKEWFGKLFGSIYPGMTHYWNEVSYGKLQLDASTIIGWFELPGERKDYQPAQGSFNYTLAANQCVKMADPTFDFSPFTVYHFLYNQPLEAQAYGMKSFTVTVEGSTKTIGAIWLGSDQYIHQELVAHELGHTLGFPHTSSGYRKKDESSNAYDSPWDVMSKGGDNSYCLQKDKEFGCIASQPIAYHKEKAGWIPLESIVIVPQGMSQNVQISSHSVPTLLGRGPLMIKVPFGANSTRYFTIELRTKEGYDKGLLYPGILIHDNYSRIREMEINGSVRDEGAVFIPGETFYDSESNVLISVKSIEGNNAVVLVENNIKPTTSTDFAKIKVNIGKKDKYYPTSVYRKFGFNYFTVNDYLIFSTIPWEIGNAVLPGEYTFGFDWNILEDSNRYDLTTEKRVFAQETVLYDLSIDIPPVKISADISPSIDDFGQSELVVLSMMNFGQQLEGSNKFILTLSSQNGLFDKELFFEGTLKNRCHRNSNSQIICSSILLNEGVNTSTIKLINASMEQKREIEFIATWKEMSSDKQESFYSMNGTLYGNSPELHAVTSWNNFFAEGYEAKWISQTTPNNAQTCFPVSPGENVPVTIELLNTGSRAWISSNYLYATSFNRCTFSTYKDISATKMAFAPSAPSQFLYDDPTSLEFGKSYFFDVKKWKSEYSPGSLDQLIIKPGEKGKVLMQFSIPQNAEKGRYREDFSFSCGPYWVRNEINGDELNVMHSWSCFDIQ